MKLKDEQSYVLGRVARWLWISGIVPCKWSVNKVISYSAAAAIDYPRYLAAFLLAELYVSTTPSRSRLLLSLLRTLDDYRGSEQLELDSAFQQIPGGNLHAKIATCETVLSLTFRTTSHDDLSFRAHEAFEAKFSEKRKANPDVSLGGLAFQHEEALLAWLMKHGLNPLNEPGEQAILARFQAESDVPETQYIFSLAYAEGFLVTRDPKKSTSLLREAATAGWPDAQCTLGHLLNIGWEGLPTDKAESIRWLQAAAEQGHAGAAHLLKKVSDQSH
jgi:hypothetical protein